MQSKWVQRCTTCILPATFPNISFDDRGLCTYCQAALDESAMALERQSLRKRMESAIEQSRGKGEYDCIVAFSGGKDSSYTLMRLVRDYDLNCLAVTIDNGFISDQARQNCYTVTEALGVDFSFFRPAPKFMANMYRTSVTTGGVQTPASIKRASAICNSCISLINNLMVKFALQYESPIIAGGYIGGQVPKNMAVLDLNLIQQERMRAPQREKYTDIFGPAASQFFFIRQSLLQKQPEGRVMVINPMLTMAISEEEIIASIGELGWTPTKDTGRNSSNCRLNDLGIAIHYKKHQFHPYAFEIAEQVRYGLMSRGDALKKVEEIPEFAHVSQQMSAIGLNQSDL
ncbi:MAG: hypothetical protein AAF702_26185 [Chloroflexota bacterium]